MCVCVCVYPGFVSSFKCNSEPPSNKVYTQNQNAIAIQYYVFATLSSEVEQEATHTHTIQTM